MNVSIELSYSLDCKCGEKTVTAGSLRWAYFWLLLHTQRCKVIPKGERPKLLKSLWLLFRWKQ